MRFAKWNWLPDMGHLEAVYEWQSHGGNLDPVDDGKWYLCGDFELGSYILCGPFESMEEAQLERIESWLY